MIKVSGVPFFLCRHFRTLKDLPDVEYGERLPPENSRLLREGELDVALIPSDEFAADGGYIGLDFGLGSIEKTDCLYLCSNCPADKLEKIYAQQGLSASLLLFTFLLKECWSTSPRIVKSRFHKGAGDVGSREGVLVRFEGPKEEIPDFEYKYDLGEEWYSLMGTPFIYLIWSARPGRLSKDQLRMFYDALHRSVKAGSKIARANAEVFDCSPEETEKFFEDNFLFAFDDDVQKALSNQFKACAKLNLIPEMDYDHAFINLVNQEPSYSGSRHEDDILHSALCGKRLSMQDARVLLGSQSVSQMMAVASTKTPKINPRVSLRLSISPKDLEEVLSDKSLIEKLDSNAFDRICINSSESTENLAYFEDLIIKTSQNFSCQIECFSAYSLLKKIRGENLSITKTASRLAACGLHSVGPDSEMPYTQFSSKRYNISIDELLRMHKWLHTYNISTYCCVPGNQVLSENELVSHLHQLRMLQDFTRGAGWLVLEPYTNKSLNLKFLHKTAVSALFMDNISSTAIYLSDASALSSCIQLACFVNEIFLDTNLKDLESNIAARTYFSSFIDTEVNPRLSI